MKKLSLILAGLSLGSAAYAADASVTMDLTYASEYVFRGVENASNSLQPSVEVTTGPWNFGLWTNQPLTKHENNEVDLYAGWAKDLNPRLKLETVATYYWYPEAHASRGQTLHSYEVGAGLTWKAGGFSPNVYYYHDFRLDAHTVQGAIGYSVPLEVFGASLDTSFMVGNVDFRNGAPDVSGPKFRDTYSYWGADMTIPFKIRPNATLSLGAHYTSVENLSFAGGAFGTVGRRNLWFTAGLSVGF